MMSTPNVLHVDEHLLVIEKPAGLACVPGRGALASGSMSQRVQALFPDALIVHRLDMATSGLVLMARGPAAHRLLSMAFQERAVAKFYQAIVLGSIEAESGVIDLPLAADWPRRPMQRADPRSGKPSLTRFRVLQRDAVTRRTRVELEPVTGRSHQLRVHKQALGHPILGDALYGPAATAGAPIAERLMLHASRLNFTHPISGGALAFQSAPPF